MKNVTPENSITPVTPKQVAHFIKKMQGNPDTYGEVCLLLGAGCSLKAGIPLAAGIVKDICRDYAEDIDIVCRNKEKTYKNCMMALEPAEREKVIRDYIDNSTINWAHLYAAALMKEKFIKRVYTVNFDPVFIKAAAMQGLYPAVYDLAVQRYRPNAVMDPSIFYLHGQGSGFLQIHDGERQTGDSISGMGGYNERLGELFAAEADSHMWVVVGYSGDNDPVFDAFINNASGRHKIIWVRHDGNNPCGEVMQGLMKLPDSSRFLCRDYEADAFFRDVANELDISLPCIIEEPFKHLLDLGKEIAPYPWKEEGRKDPIVLFRERLEKADRKFPATPEEKDLASLAEGKPENITGASTEIRAWALFDEAYKLQVKAKASSDPEEKRKALLQASEKYEEATRIKPDFHEAFNNWGVALATTANVTDNPREKQGYLQQALEKYGEATHISPDFYEAFNNWGSALSYMANVTDNSGEKQSYLLQACEKHEEATRITPDFHEAFNKWGIALGTTANITHIPEKKRSYLTQACEKFERAIRIKLDYHEALINWGITLGATANIAVDPDEKRGWLLQASEKFEGAIRIKPDYHEAFYNWGVALATTANIAGNPEEKQRCLQQAHEKYREATRIKPDYHEAFNSWGNALGYMADIAENPREKQSCLLQACEKYETATRIKPDYHEAFNSWGVVLLRLVVLPAAEKEKAELLSQAREQCLKAEELKPGRAAYNLACVASLWGEANEAMAWLEKSREYGFLPKTNHLDTDTDLDPIRDTEAYKAFRASLEDKGPGNP